MFSPREGPNSSFLLDPSKYDGGHGTNMLEDPIVTLIPNLP